MRGGPRKNSANRRRGQVMAMTCILMPTLFAGALVSSDTVLLANAQAQLQTMADASALAGAAVLVDDTRLTGTTDLAALMSKARAAANSIAAKNLVLGNIHVIADNPTNNASGDVVAGYLATTDYTSLTVNSSTSQSTFNAIQVTASQAVNTFFGPAVGKSSATVPAAGIAIAQNYAVAGVKSFNGNNVDLLPIVLDNTTYTAMMNRTTADQYSYSSSGSTNAVTAGADGIPESQLYPVGTGNPGNWGTIKVGVSNNSTATLAAQMQYGITSTQMATFPGSAIQLDTTLSPPAITFGGNPGISAGISSSLTSQIGKVKYVGIYDQSSGNGNNTTYRVIGFAAIRIMAVNFQGNPKYVVVQPALTRDGSVIKGAVQPSWTNGGLVHVFLAR